MNGANVEDTGKYAVAGGNEEIIHLCEQNYSTFENAIETAIKFHRNEIFKYIYENKFEKMNENNQKIPYIFGNENHLHSSSSNDDYSENSNEIEEEDLYEGYKIVIMKYSLEELGKKCILYNNYEIFIFLEKEGMNINDIVIDESAKIGNIFLTKYFLVNNEIPKDILVFAARSGNIELVKDILEKGEVDINAKDIFLL